MLHKKLGRSRSLESSWSDTSAWTKHSTKYDFHVPDSFGYIWGLPILVPTCPRKLFEQGPRKNFVDIVTDALHASSSDVITCNTLAMVRQELQEFIPATWKEITVASLDAWEERDKQSPFLPDNRGRYAHVRPVGLTCTGKPSPTLMLVDQYPLHALGLYFAEESSLQFLTYFGQDGRAKPFSQCKMIRTSLIC